MSPPSSAPARIVFLLPVLIGTALVYLPALAGPFVLDDHVLIEADPAVHELRSPREYFGRQFLADSSRPDEDRTFYRPLVVVSYALDWIRGGGQPGPFHVTNLLAHLLVCALVYTLALQGGASTRAAALATAAFGVQPRLAESVAWISGRTDVLATACALGAVLLYRPEPERAPGRWAASALLLVGLLCKEVAIAALGAIAVIELGRFRDRREPLRAMIWRLAPLACALFGYAALRLGASSGTLPAPVLLPLWRRVLMPVQALGTYLSMVLDPFRPRLQIGVLGILSPLPLAAGVVALAGIAVAVVWMRRARPRTPVAAALAMAAIALVLVLHVVPIPVKVVAADRFLYAPFAALAVATALGADRLEGGWRRPAGGIVLLLAVTLAIRANKRAEEWTHELALWRTAAREADPLDAPVLIGLADAESENADDREALAHYEEACIREERVLRILGSGSATQDERCLINIAIQLSRLGNYPASERLLRDLAKSFPSDAKVQIDLALVLARELRFDDAGRVLALVRERWPGLDAAADVERMVLENRTRRAELAHANASDARLELAGLDAELGRIAEARSRYVELVRDPRTPAEALVRAAAFLVRNGRIEDAREGVERCREVAPSRQEPLALQALLRHREDEERWAR